MTLVSDAIALTYYTSSSFDNFLQKCCWESKLSNGSFQPYLNSAFALSEETRTPKTACSKQCTYNCKVELRADYDASRVTTKQLQAIDRPLKTSDWCVMKVRNSIRLHALQSKNTAQYSTDNIVLYSTDSVKIVKWQSYYKCGHWTLPPPCSVVDYCILTELLVPSLQMTLITRLPCLSHEHIEVWQVDVQCCWSCILRQPFSTHPENQLSETSLKVFYSLNFITHQNTIL